VFIQHLILLFLPFYSHGDSLITTHTNISHMAHGYIHITHYICISSLMTHGHVYNS